jgi:hypothetical protein
MTDAPALIEDHDELPTADGIPVDPRLAFLARAAAKFYLVEHGLEELDGAFHDLDRACRAISPCCCEIEMLRAWAKQDRETAERQLREWRLRPAATRAWSKRRP